MKIKLPKRIDSFTNMGEGLDGGFFAEYDGWHFEAKSEKAVINQILKYIFEELEKEE